MDSWPCDASAVQRTALGYGRWLAVTATAYVVLHHLGLAPHGFGTAPDHSQWADWLDLTVPFLTLAPAASALRAADASARTWLLFGVGAVTYATGHGIHLAANSIGNSQPSDTAHLWDEVVGHEIWYAGVALVAAALAVTMRAHPRPGPLGYLIAVMVGLTWASNAAGGGTLVLSLACAVAATAYGWAHRHELGVVLGIAGALSAAVLLTLVAV
jgi:hypothetical protein